MLSADTDILFWKDRIKHTERHRKDFVSDEEYELCFEQIPDIIQNPEFISIHPNKDSISFMISTNPGEPVLPLQKVVSGGELSRIMLAIKTLLADKDQTETLIFDEIDTGISGRTAQKVAEKMKVIGENHQVLCITHLPQIASQADGHFLIEKNVENMETTTRIRRLSYKESVEELARMLGGAKITDAVLQNAAEMKDLAQQQKNTRLK